MTLDISSLNQNIVACNQALQNLPVGERLVYVNGGWKAAKSNDKSSTRSLAQTMAEMTDLVNRIKSAVEARQITDTDQCLNLIFEIGKWREQSIGNFNSKQSSLWRRFLALLNYSPLTTYQNEVQSNAAVLTNKIDETYAKLKPIADKKQAAQVKQDRASLPKSDFHKALLEFTVTEATFCKSLRVIQQIGMRLEQNATQVVKAMPAKLKGEFKKLVDICEVFLQNSEYYTSQCKRPQDIAQALGEKERLLSFGRAKEMVEIQQRITSMAGGADFMKKIDAMAEEISQTELGMLLNFDALVITVAQRFPRYELLLDACIKQMPEDHADKKAFQEALENLQAVKAELKEAELF